MPILAPDEVATEEVKGWKGLHLFHASHSLCSRKVRLFLAEKELDWNSHLLNLPEGEQNTPWYLGINPRGLVPVLVHDGKVIIESNDIMLYLDENFEGKAKMMPQTLDEIKITHDLLHLEDSVHMDIRLLSFATKPRAKLEESMRCRIAKLSASTGSKTVGGATEAAVGGQSFQEQLNFARRLVEAPSSLEDKEKSKQSVKAIMTTAQQQLGDKQYMLGDRITLLDIAYFMTMDRFRRVCEHDWSVSHPVLYRHYARLLSRPSFLAESENN